MKILKSILIFVAIYISTGFLFACNSRVNNDNYPISLSIDTIFFSIYNIDSLAQVVFVKNNSAKPIKIIGVENGCGCTSVILNDSTIKEKDSVSIKLFYAPSISKDSGDVLKYITLRTDATPAFYNIILKGKIKL